MSNRIRPKPPRSAWVVRATPAGRKAQEVWQPLFGAVEKRWQERFGKNEIGQLRESLWAVASQLDVELPDGLPILGYGLFSRGPDLERRASAQRDDGTGSHLPLSALLSRVLLAPPRRIPGWQLTRTSGAGAFFRVRPTQKNPLRAIL